MQKNLNIRKRIADAKLRHWQVADELGVSQSLLSIWLRHELPPDKQLLIMSAIDRMTERTVTADA